MKIEYLGKKIKVDFDNACNEPFDPIICIDGSKVYHKCMLPKLHQGNHFGECENTFWENVSDLLFTRCHGF